MSDDGVPGYTHPAFAAHFTDPLYDDPADDFAPFGSDEGADLFVDAEARRAELGPTSTVADVLELHITDDGPGFVAEIGEESPDVDGFVIGAGFALLRLTGQIDPTGRRWLTDALDRTLRYYSDGFADTHAILTRDLASF